MGLWGGYRTDMQKAGEHITGFGVLIFLCQSVVSDSTAAAEATADTTATMTATIIISNPPANNINILVPSRLFLRPPLRNRENFQ